MLSPANVPFSRPFSELPMVPCLKCPSSFTITRRVLPNQHIAMPPTRRYFASCMRERYRATSSSAQRTGILGVAGVSSPWRDTLLGSKKGSFYTIHLALLLLLLLHILHRLHIPPS
ncbi:hypothetical protein BDZ91DRAFT_739278 [Kalaharituber pfeilii]|nr:hypothetical protein BDZ91DRAFT_739278 [Kalaharituber pfeilii]